MEWCRSLVGCVSVRLAISCRFSAAGSSQTDTIRLVLDHLHALGCHSTLRHGVIGQNLVVVCRRTNVSFVLRQDFPQLFQLRNLLLCFLFELRGAILDAARPPRKQTLDAVEIFHLDLDGFHLRLGRVEGESTLLGHLGTNRSNGIGQFALALGAFGLIMLHGIVQLVNLFSLGDEFQVLVVNLLDRIYVDGMANERNGMDAIE